MFRSVAQGILKNSSVMFVQQVITWSTNFLLLFFLGRMLGAVEYGRLFLATSISGLFGVLVQYGGHYLVSKHVARDKSKTAQILVDAVAFRILFALVAFVAMMAFALLMGYDADTRILLAIFGIMLFWQGATISLYASFQGHEMMQYTSQGTIVERTFSCLVGVAALFAGFKSLGLVIVGVVGNFLNLLVLLKHSRNIVGPLPNVDWNNVRSQLKEGFPYFLLAVFGLIYYRIGAILLSKLTPEEVMGWYGAAYKIFEISHFLPFILSTAIYPVLSRLWTNEADVHRRTTQKGLELMIVSAVPVSMLMFAFADRAISIVYGKAEFAPAAIVLQVFYVGLVFMYLDIVLGTTLLAADKQRSSTLIALGAIPLTFVLNYLLIPLTQERFGNGSIGSAAATGITEMFIMIAYLRVMPKGVLAGFRYSVIAKTLAAGIPMFGSLWLMNSLAVPWYIQAVASAAVYTVAVFSFRTFEPAEEQFLRRILAVRNIDAFKALMRPGQS